ncbi:MAG TPA: S49 family peptidase [Noviherbaspirillum sp.]|nr:S49 family peptidase [Noviherbaspirillum sp.]
MPNRAMRALLSEPWAIDPGYLPLLAAIAQRNHSAPELEAAAGWAKRDYQMMAGPSAIKLDGSYRSFVSEGVAIIPVTGPIFPRANLMTEMSGATSCAMIQNDLAVAANSEDVGAILMMFDTPGGAVSGVNATADMMDQMSKKKKMASFVTGTAASAGYWLASQTGEIVLERTGIVGSIGVVVTVPKQVQADSNGYVEFEIVSSNAANKRPDPSTEDGQAEVRATLDAIEREFIADVARGMGVSTETVIEKFGQGGIKVGADAIKAGMAHRIDSYGATLKRMQNMVRANKRASALKK